MARRFCYDYYDVSVPGDVFDTEDPKECLRELGQLAIQEAEQRTKLYCIPAVWTAEHVSGEPGDWEVKFRVCRKRNRVAVKV